MTTPEAPRPQYSSSYPPPPPPAAPAPARRRGPVLIGIAAAATGAVLGAALAAPVAWVVADHTLTSTSAGDELVEGADGQDGPRGITPEWGQGQSPDLPGTTNSSSFEDATEEESTGVMLIDVAANGSRGAGTGWVVDDSGLVVTNYHVVSGSNEVRATDAATGDSWTASVVGHDAEADVALLQLEDADDLTEVTLDDDGDPAVGDDVTAVGNASGQGFLSASDGAVVGLGQDIETTNPATGATSPLSGLIQTDARVVQGFSGGVLIDDEDEVVGITTAASAGRGAAQSYAVPIEDALDIVDQIRADDESGSVQIGPGAYLGISVAGNGQVRVQGVQEDGAAAEAGLEPGSTITGLDGQDVTDFARLQEILRGLEPGDTTTLTWTGPGGAQQDASITLGESPQN
ncbi:S1C family serine protease [Nocardioides panacisoli]|uniref:S1C family serine protease n=1 Tax=Nocardioides panacisoli TaxID=627624 RepID=UPI001C633C9A|nr:trypsin-like peptidase domain-containing protein [Nocardioides panacisoli]QYJ05552.1 S1C family serine protease [Nocardioides panacisoli]